MSDPVRIADLAPSARAGDVARAPAFAGRIVMARTATLHVSPLYQRAMVRDGWARVRGIAAAFDWAKFGTLIVRRIDEDRVEVIDGQHRALAAILCGVEKVPAMLVEGGGAGIFVAVNTCRAAVKPEHLFHAERAAGEAEASALGAALDAAGIEVMRVGKPGRLKPGQTLAVRALRRMWRARGADPAEAEAVLTILSAAAPHDGRSALIDPVIRAVTALVAAIEADADCAADDGALIEALDALERLVRARSPLAFLDEARLARAAHGGALADHLARLMANALPNFGGPEIAVGV